MLFPTLSFAAFFAVVLPVSWLLMPRRVRWRLFMVAASWFFYGAADWRFVPLLAGSTIANHFFARRIHRATGANRRNWTVVAVAANLAVLAWFKYVGFLSLSAQSSLRYLGLHVRVPLPEVLLPIGISFFTFQALSYVIDTARGKIRPVSLLEFAVYLSFFPHLIAGPIVRATEFLPQIKERIGPRHVDVGKAFWLISMGLFKKVVIASYLATYAADPLFGFPRQHAGVEALFGVYAYAIQIYADFSGYTDIAIGLALLLGIQFPQNFNAPYSAASLQDFWRRWHMTLSRWLRDYLYIPLGGSRRGRWRTYVNIMITMLLGGLWHGAAWTFVAWGALHGFGLIVERWRGERRPTPGAVAERDNRLGSTPAPAFGAGIAPPPSTPAPASSVSGHATALTLPRGDLIVVARVGEPAARTAPPRSAGLGSPPPPSVPLRPKETSGSGAHSAAEAQPPETTVLASAPPPLPRPGATRRPRPLRAERLEATATVATSEGSDRDEWSADADGDVSGAATWDSLVLGRPMTASTRGTQEPGPVLGTDPDRDAPPPVLGAGRALTATAAAAAPPVAKVPQTNGSATDGNPPATPGRPPASPGRRLWVGRLVTFHVVCLAWIFFRATSFHNAMQVLGRIATLGGHHHPFNWKVAAVIVGALAVQVGPPGGGAKLQALFSRRPFWVQALIVAGVLSIIDLLGPAGVAPFIYFRF